MATEVYMPKNGMDMTEGTIIRWLKNEGDRVERDEPIMEIETDKITMESESPADGVLLKKLYDDGAVVPVLTVIGYIGEEGEAVPDAPAADAPAEEKKEAAAAAPAEAAPAAAPAAQLKGDGVAATPMARRLAKEMGIDLAAVRPTGKHGEVVAADVENAKGTQPNASMLAARIAADQGIDLSTVTGTGFGGKIMSGDLQVSGADEAGVADLVKEIEELIERRRMTGMRKAIAKQMLKSHTEIPPVTQTIKVDVTDLLELRGQINAGLEKEEKVSVNDIIIKAVGKAITKFERFRMSLDGNEYVLNNQINVSVAVGMDDGLVTPVLRNVDKKSLYQISQEAKAMVKKAREGKLQPEELKGGRITISNIGMYGTHTFTPIINLPEASIVGICGVEDELALVEGEVVVRKKMMVCVTYDHRILNGTEICEFELYLKKLLENPLSIII